MDIRPLEGAPVQTLIDRIPLGTYLQSDAWAAFQHAYGRRVVRLGAFEGSELRGAMTLITHELVMNKTYLYVPHGPLATDPETFSALLGAALDVGRTTGAMYVKVDVPVTAFPVTNHVPAGFFPGTALQPRYTQVIDPRLSDEALLAAMHQKTRYNLRLAQKKGVVIRWSTSDDDFAMFMMLQHQTAARQQIRLHPDHYYQLMWQTLRDHQMVELGIAEYNGVVVAINEIIWGGTTATYIHGGSSNHHKEVMAPYVLQWETMQRARTKNMAAYDLRGIAPADQPDHKLAGVTRFKVGLGGHAVVYPEAQNAVLQPSWYWAYRMAKRFRGGRDD